MKHELGASEHVKHAIVDPPPREIEESVAPLPVHRWSPEVELTVKAPDHVNVELPPR